jgi:alanine racemase
LAKRRANTSRMFTRPLWAEVSRNRLLTNYQKLRQAAGSQADLLPVVKANAYGHDLLACAPLLAGAGAQWLGVTGAEEGAAVRAVCPQPRILLMSGIFPGEADTVIEQNLTPVVWEPWHLDLLEAAGAARNLPAASLAVHLEIDTGMSRQGMRVIGTEISPDAVALLRRFHPGSCLRLEAVMTHFCAPEIMSSHRPNPQLASLAAALEIILAQGPSPQWLHAGNSSSIVAGSDRQALIELASSAGMRLMLRPGLALYGYLDRLTMDGLSWDGEDPGLAPVLAWKTQVTSLRTLHPGETAGYGRTFTAEGETRLGLLPVGYADGLNRLLSNRGWVLIRGQEAPIAGRVSMDQTTVDVTAIPGVAIGDEVVLLGSQGAHSIDAWDLADLTGTIPWEVLCAISARVPRVLVA